jgi:hypothetical protein
MVVPIDYFSVDFLAFEVTFVPDDPNQLPSRQFFWEQVNGSGGCPTEYTVQDSGPSSECAP